MLHNIAETICSAISKCCEVELSKHYTSFISAGERTRTPAKAATVLLNRAKDWHMMVDMVRKTSLKPFFDIVNGNKDHHHA